MSDPLMEAELKFCNGCKKSVQQHATECPNCKGTVFTKMYKRFRKERIVFILLASVAIGIIVFIIASTLSGRIVPEAFLFGLLVISFYAAANFFFGLKFHNYYVEGEIPEEARQDFSRSYFLAEFLVFIRVFVCVLLLAIMVGVFRYFYDWALKK